MLSQVCFSKLPESQHARSKLRPPRFCFGGIPVGHDGTRLQCHSGVPAKDELCFHHFVGAGESRIDGASIKIALEGEVITQRWMDDRGLWIERRAHIRHRRQFPVFNPDDLSRILRRGAAGPYDGGDGLALPADPVDRDRMLRRGFETFQVREHADPRRDDGGKLRPVTTAMTPGIRRASVASMLMILAWACGERRNTTCPIRGSSMSLT